MDADQVLAFRLARSGLATRTAPGFAVAAACPASDFARDAALLALGARAEGLSREAYQRAVDAGDLVVARVVRGAIHAVAPGDFALYGRGLMGEDRSALGSPPAAHGIRLIPSGDPYLQKANRALLVPESDLRKRLFRPVASPGAVLKNGRLVGLWRVKTKRAKTELTVEKTGRLTRRDLEEEAQRMAKLRGVAEAVIVLA